VRRILPRCSKDYDAQVAAGSRGIVSGQQVLKHTVLRQSSSAVCGAFISTAKRSICIGIWREYDFRYNHRVALGFNDGERAALAVKNASGKRSHVSGNSLNPTLARQRGVSCDGAKNIESCAIGFS
jgi:hypothetical protein